MCARDRSKSSVKNLYLPRVSKIIRQVLLKPPRQNSMIDRSRGVSLRAT